MTLDEKIEEVLEGYPQLQIKDMIEFRALCKRVLRDGGDGEKLLTILTFAVPPMAPSITTSHPNDPMAVGYNEGLREAVATLFRHSGNAVVDETQPAKQPAKQPKR